MNPAQIIGWMSAIERTVTTAATIRAMLEEGLTPEQIDKIIARADQRVENLRDMDLRG